MDSDLTRVVQQALEDARSAGCDDLTQTERAVRAVVQVRPDMTGSEALTAVNPRPARTLAAPAKSSKSAA